jgi:phenylalanyl-tRNA synthetase beta chain
MRIPLRWLSEFVDVDLDPEALAERLTLLGMEVKTIERWGDDWQQVVVGQLLTVEKHPRADRLSLTTVTLGDGTEPLAIVCGATNIAPGQRIPVALPGAVLPGDRRIERAEKMGVISNGMLCSGDELRLTADGDGILILPADTPLGVPLIDVYGDTVLDVDVKPNRGDALSILGLAREVSAATGAPIRWQEPQVRETPGATTAERLVVEVDDREGCPRFVGRWVDGVTIGPSPDRVQMRLLAAGLRPISNVVDASNYVMLELGKPIHTYDADRVAAGSDGRRRIGVRRATAGERLETLDHIDRELSTEDLLITDPSGPIGLAGVMGGSTTEVGEATTTVIVESAIFDPVTIRRTAQRHALRSEASGRFEKGQEVRLARIGADRTAELLAEWAGGRIAPGRVDTNEREPGPTRVAFRPARVDRLLGAQLTADEQRALLERVGVATEATSAAEPVTIALTPEALRVDAAPGEALVAIVPTWRRDLLIEADIAEEVARVRGYELTPSVTPDTPMPAYRHSPLAVRDTVRETLAGAGLSEAVTPALVSPRHLERFPIREPVESVDGEPAPVGRPIHVTNPLSQDHSILRQSLIPSLLDVVSTNLRRGTDDVAIFEIGRGYAANGDRPREWWRLAFVLVGAVQPPSWNQPRRAWDVDDAKGLLELVARRLGLEEPSYIAVGDEPSFHPGRTAAATASGPSGPSLQAIVGELHPSIAEAWELRTSDRIIAAEVALTGLSGGGLAAERAPIIGRFQPVERDLAIVVRGDVPAAAVLQLVRREGGKHVRDVRLFDIYRGTPLAADEQSLAVRITLEALDRALTDSEVEAAITSIVKALPNVGGRRRG